MAVEFIGKHDAGHSTPEERKDSYRIFEQFSSKGTKGDDVYGVFGVCRFFSHLEFVLK
jgi:hypothetical protein